MSNTSGFYTGGDQNLGELVDSYHEVFENTMNNNLCHTVKINLQFLRMAWTHDSFLKHRCAPLRGLQAKFREVRQPALLNKKVFLPVSRELRRKII